MTDQKGAYRQIMKSTSIFGGVQVFQIVVNIISSKFIAIFLGPLGMGIVSLLTTTIDFIGSLTNFGLGTSAIKNISSAYSTENSKRLSTIVIVFRRLVWITGLLGALIAAILSPFLSRLSFGNSNFTYAFLSISIILLIRQISVGQGVILRGTRQISHMAKSGLIGSTIGLFTTIPLYYFLGQKGIVPGIIISALTSLLLNWYYSRKIKILPVYVSKVRTIAEGKEMLTMGFMISLSGMITLGISYIVRAFIGRYGGIEQVGLYSAGFAIINTYVGLIFTAMSMDYYPRLSAVADSNEKCKTAINQQIEISILILAPVIIIFLVFIKWIIILLYSTMFLGISSMVYWAALGMFFKALSWPISYILLAKAASKTFFWNELITNTYMLGLNIAGYYYFGLTGLGISFLVTYIIYSIQVFIIANRNYKFSFTSDLKKLFIFQFFLALTSLGVVFIFTNLYSYFIGFFLIILSGYYSYKELDKRLNIRDTISTLLKR
ncbi:MAG: oligosaccharide flippase family protein [Paludibacter sp.]